MNTGCPEVLPAKKYIVQYQNSISSVSNAINGIPNDITAVRYSTICDVTILFLFYFLSFHIFFNSVSCISMVFKVTCHTLNFPLPFFSPTFLLLCHFFILFPTVLPFSLSLARSLSLPLLPLVSLCVRICVYEHLFLFFISM